jgi:hypothetical protein
MQRRKTLGLIVFTMFYLIGCDPTPKEENDISFRSEQQIYYKRISDAPIDFYCYVDNLLDTKERVGICGKLGPYQSDNLTADILLSLDSNKVTESEVLFLYFNENGNPQKDTSKYDHLGKILDAIDIQQVPSLKFLGKGDFAFRLQLERFCIEQVQFYDAKQKANEAVDKAFR